MLKCFRQQDWTRFSSWLHAVLSPSGSDLRLFRSTDCYAVLGDWPQQIQRRPKSDKFHRADLMHGCTSEWPMWRRGGWLTSDRQQEPLVDDITNHIKHRHAVGSRDHWHVSVNVFPRMCHRSQWCSLFLVYCLCGLITSGGIDINSNNDNYKTVFGPIQYWGEHFTIFSTLYTVWAKSRPFFDSAT